jgi:hypothetical protein
MWKTLNIGKYDSGKFTESLTSPGPADGISEILSQLGCKSVIVELDYIDFDFEDEFRLFYSRLFRGFSKRCKRVHFFSKETIPTRRLNANGGIDVPDLIKITDKEYLGYCVLRPTAFNRVGRTVLKSPFPKETPCCRANFQAHILGRRFSFVGMPFIQQDSQAGACVHAAIWMAARYFSSRFNFRPICISEINSLVKLLLPSGKMQTDKGLYINQLLGAVENLGFSCSIHDKNSCTFWASRYWDGELTIGHLVNQTANLICPYLESGLPVFFTTTDHAYLVIGFHDQPQSSSRECRVKTFIAHDDGKGPYGIVNVDSIFKDVLRIAVCVPPGVNLFAERVEDHLREFLEALPHHRDLQKGLTGPEIQILKELVPKLVFRTILIASADFQEMLSHHLLRSSEVFDSLYAMDYPKYLWITDLIDSETQKAVGFSIVDSTAAPKVKQQILSLHFGPVFYSCNIQNTREQIDLVKSHGGILHHLGY